ncbi:hypothetical protein QBC35DRAFT_59785 [Podospora australis]|uniref:SET domain-containing protein n=1 Tax=Podospora australis TaxID=1536484 RepID=A0AAN6WLX2_9PEZI|nr:hypothetical protein QBC35DRAFT_59785 [Podospora australis]
MTKTHHGLAAAFFLTALHLVSGLQVACPADALHPFKTSRQSGLLVDNETPSLDLPHIPWTHAPYCSESFTDTPGEKFCVFSSSAYNLHSGISILTDPETAAGLALQLNDLSLPWAARHHLSPRGEFRPDPDTDLPYTLIDIPGKGKGVVATRKINQFETIMKAYPAVIADNVFFPQEEGDSGQGNTRARKFFQKALEQLGDLDRIKKMARSRKGKVHLLEDVVRTNAFGMTINGRDCKGMYPEIARLNHACDPNAFPRFTSKDLAMTAVATRDILPGEEITISYIPLGMPSSYRAKSLGNWHFECSCGLCQAPKQALEASDSRREQIVELYVAMQDPSTTHDQLVEMTREFIELAQVERLITKIGEYYQVFMRLYYEKGDPQTAKKYGRAALKFAEIFGDPDGGFCAGLRKDLDVLERVIRESGES